MVLGMKVHRNACIKTGLGWRYIDNRRLTVLYQTSVQQQSSCPILIREMNRRGKPSYTTRNRQTEVSNRPFAKVPAFTTPCPETDIPETLALANASPWMALSRAACYPPAKRGLEHAFSLIRGAWCDFRRRSLVCSSI